MKLFGSSPWRHVIGAALICCFLAFVAGAFVADFRIFPYQLMFKNAFAYVHAVQERGEMEQESRSEAQAELKTAKPRVTIPASPEAFQGYTFLTYDTAHPSTARLIDMEGKVVHEWHRSLREIWPVPPQRDEPSPEDVICWRYARLYPNGDIIATIKSYGDTPDGYGLAKLDKDSKVIWAVPDNFHHHFSMSDDGHIYGLTHHWRNTVEHPLAGVSHLPPKVLEDFVVELSPEGKELSRVSLLKAMAAPDVRDLLGAEFFNNFHTKGWDPIHPNDVEIIGADFASHHSFMQPGMVMVSLRDLDTLIVLDLKTRKVIWAMRGAWVRQHDPDLLSNGNVLLFDNRGQNVKDGGSRILELLPESGRIVWSYAGSSEHPFRSDKSGGEQRLPNGNTLITEDDAGRVFEVNPKGQIVWEYRDARMHHASRVAKDWLKFVPDALAASSGVAASTSP